MSGVKSYLKLNNLVTRLRSDLNDKELVLLYAYNRTGKTRLSMAFKDRGKHKNGGNSDTLYFNAFTEDLFTWENDLENDVARGLRVNHFSKFFDGFTGLVLEPTIDQYLRCYADFGFDFEYKEVTQGEDTFTKPHFVKFNKDNDDNIKISRGEERLFILCIFMAFCELVINGHDSYQWVKYIYIDDPVSSLDDNNAISVACDLAKILRRSTNRKDEHDSLDPIKVVVSSHHSLFFNVMCNEIGRSKVKHKRYFLHRSNSEVKYALYPTDDTPFFHHVAILAELQAAAKPGGTIYTFHFNALRSIMEKTAIFFGHSNISFCLEAFDDENRALFNRVLNLLSHGGYDIYAPDPMSEDNQDLFRNILKGFIDRFKFNLTKM